MAIVVEDGTGKSDAESYATVDQFTARCALIGQDHTGKTPTQIEQALRRGTAWLDASYRGRFCGIPKNVPDQALEWPRIGAVDNYGYSVDPDSVPSRIVAACIEASYRELITPNSLMPDYTGAERIKRISKSVGPLKKEIEYQGGSGTAADTRPVIGVIAGILAPLLKTDMAGGGMFGRSERV